MDLVEGVAGGFDPGERECCGEAVELGAEVGVAQEFGRAGVEQEEVFEEQGEGAQESESFGLAVGSGTVCFGHLEEGGVVGFGLARYVGGVAEKDEGVGAGCGVAVEVEGEGATGCSLREAGDQGALFGGDIGAARGDEGFDLLDRERTEADVGAAGADGGQQLSGILGEDDDVDGVRRLLEDLEQGVGGLLHHAGGGEDEDLARRLAGQVVRALDEGADLAELDEELGRVGRQDEDVRVGLDEDAGLFLVGLTELLAG